MKQRSQVICFNKKTVLYYQTCIDQQYMLNVKFLFKKNCETFCLIEVFFI